MDTIIGIYSVISILAVLCILVGLWIARKFLPACTNWIRPQVNNELLSKLAVKIILWLSLGGLFTLPLLDFVRWLENLATIVFMPASQLDIGLSSFLGQIPPRAYYGFYLILLLVIYGVVFWLSADYLPTPGQFNRTERSFIVLSVASLVYHSFMYLLSNFPQVSYRRMVVSAGS
jgi:hypothetical protein